MNAVLLLCFWLRGFFCDRCALAAENLALRQRLVVLRRSVRRPRLRPWDRLFWACLSRWWAGRKGALLIVTPATAAESTVARYMARRTRPPSPTWKSFLANHAGCLASVDFFVVHTVTFRLMYVFVVLCHERRRAAHFNVTTRPAAAWAARQVREAFPFDEAPRYLIRDNDGVYGECFRQCLKSMGVEDVPIVPHSPWQNPYVERLIGSIRRECLDHVIVFNEAHLKRVLSGFFDYYHRARVHQSLEANAPYPREVEPPGRGRVVAVPQVGGLHHRYTRVA